MDTIVDTVYRLLIKSNDYTVRKKSNGMLTPSITKKKLKLFFVNNKLCPITLYGNFYRLHR
jgi:hypothetical protein